MKDMKKCVRVLIIDVCINNSERHMAGFLGGVLCTSAYMCIFVCIVLWEYRQNVVTQGRLFG